MGPTSGGERASLCHPILFGLGSDCAPQIPPLCVAAALSCICAGGLQNLQHPGQTVLVILRPEQRRHDTVSFLSHWVLVDSILIALALGWPF